MKKSGNTSTKGFTLDHAVLKEAYSKHGYIDEKGPQKSLYLK